MWDAERTLAYFVYLPGTAHSSRMPCVADLWRCHGLGCASHLPNARPMRTPGPTQVSRPTVHIAVHSPSVFVKGMGQTIPVPSVQ
jgi:hypothetical protein